MEASTCPSKYFEKKTLLASRLSKSAQIRGVTAEEYICIMLIMNPGTRACENAQFAAILLITFHDIEQYYLSLISASSGVAVLSSIVKNYDRCGQHNIVQTLTSMF